MITKKATGRLNREAYPQLAPSFDSAGRLQELVVELTNYIERLQSNLRIREEGGAVEIWGDEEFTYLEAKLPGIVESEIDINVHAGGVYVRVMR
jgi:HSP20 family molecular chaperone IbpA